MSQVPIRSVHTDFPSSLRVGGYSDMPLQAGRKVQRTAGGGCFQNCEAFSGPIESTSPTHHEHVGTSDENTRCHRESVATWKFWKVDKEVGMNVSATRALCLVRQ